MKMDYSNAEENFYDDVRDFVDDALIKKVWRNLDEQIPLDRVNCVVFEVAFGFQNATVKTFLPILVHRRALERLRQEVNEMASQNSCSLNE